ncbi:unnamed protein product, partial [Allacma fusca]
LEQFGFSAYFTLSPTFQYLHIIECSQVRSESMNNSSSRFRYLKVLVNNSRIMSSFDSVKNSPSVTGLCQQKLKTLKQKYRLVILVLKTI